MKPMGFWDTRMRSRQNVSCGSESLPPSEIVPQTKGLEFSRLPCTIACTVISLYEAEKNRNVVETSEIPDLKTIRKKNLFEAHSVLRSSSEYFVPFFVSL